MYFSDTDNSDVSIKHARKVHHQSIIKCHDYGIDFLHEEDRQHHVQQEKGRRQIYIDIDRTLFMSHVISCLLGS